MKLIHQLYAIFQKDLLIKISYKASFVYDFISIFLKVMILYFISQFMNLDQQEEFSIPSYFSYAIFGLCFMEIMSSIIGITPREIEDMKKTGILEEIILLPINNFTVILGCNIYQVFMSIIKVIIYLTFGSLLASGALVEIEYFFIFLITFFFLISSFIFISMIASALSIWFARSSLVPILYITLSLVLGEIYFPKELLHHELSILSNLFSLSPALEVFRMLNDSSFKEQVFLINILHLLILNLIYGLTSLVIFQRAIKYAKSNGSFLYY